MPASRPGSPGDEESVGHLVSRLIDDGKAYAQAEVALWRTIGTERAKSFAVPAALVLVALLFAQAAVTLLCAGVFFALMRGMGPILAGLVTMLLALGVAGALGYVAYARIRSAGR